MSNSNRFGKRGRLTTALRSVQDALADIDPNCERDPPWRLQQRLRDIKGLLERDMRSVNNAEIDGAIHGW
jgi:hypothetical protein